MATDSGDISMITDDARYAMTVLGQAGQDLTSNWSSAHGAISGASGQTGSDLLGQTFLQTYQPRATIIAKAMRKSVQVPGLLADAGHRGIDNYEAADTMSRGFFGEISHD
ncbi:hypothetical protein GCM10009765_03880 [Fodinicola feengrottensis]|uniref:Uncharacterized protein n=2 Tax=Fodinicola feengrottensis TaxID=435914 RepID=A0ABN2FSW8_9ACTN